MAKFELQPGEQLVKQGTVGYLKSRLKLVPGDGHLTDRRFVHISTMRALAVGGILGAMAHGRIDLEVPLDSIATFSRGRHGRNESVLVIGTIRGHEHRIVTAFEEWFAAFSSALRAYRAVGMVECGPGIWQVDRA